MSKPEKTSDYAGYCRAVQSLFDQAMALADTTSDEKEAFEELSERLTGYDHQKSNVRAAMDQLPDDHIFTQEMAMFYLGYYADKFKDKLREGPHPFKRGKATTKAEVDAWHLEILQRKHADDLPEINPVLRKRDLIDDRFYVLDGSGAVVSDGHVSSLNLGELNAVFGQGAEIRILHMADALKTPWLSQEERAPWADGYVKLLHKRAEAIYADIADINSETNRGNTAEATGKPVIRRP